MPSPEIIDRKSITAVLRAASRRHSAVSGWRFEEWEERWLRSDELADVLAIHERLSESTDPEEFREVVDLFRYELRDLDEYRRGKTPKPLATAHLLIALLDVNTERSPEVLGDLLNHPRLQDSIRVSSQLPEHQRVIARVMSHPSLDGRVPDHLVRAARRLVETAMASSHASLYFITDSATLLREADNFEHKEERFSLGQTLALCDSMSEKRDPREWEHLRQFPWNFRLDHWEAIVTAALEALKLSKEEAASARASWRPNVPLLAKDESSGWQWRKAEERERLGDGDPTDSTRRLVSANDPATRVERMQQASDSAQLAALYFDWEFRKDSHTTLVLSIVQALAESPHFTLELLIRLLDETKLAYSADEAAKLPPILEAAATETEWRLEDHEVSRAFLDDHLMVRTLAVRRAKRPEYIANLWKYVSHYYGDSVNPMRGKLFGAFVDNKHTPEHIKAEAEAVLRTPSRQAPVEV